MNWYSYCGGNPIAFLDYTGFAPFEVPFFEQTEKDSCWAIAIAHLLANENLNNENVDLSEMVNLILNAVQPGVREYSPTNIPTATEALASDTGKIGEIYNNTPINSYYNVMEGEDMSGAIAFIVDSLDDGHAVIGRYGIDNNDGHFITFIGVEHVENKSFLYYVDGANPNSPDPDTGKYSLSDSRYSGVITSYVDPITGNEIYPSYVDEGEVQRLYYSENIVDRNGKEKTVVHNGKLTDLYSIKKEEN